MKRRKGIAGFADQALVTIWSSIVIVILIAATYVLVTKLIPG